MQLSFLNSLLYMFQEFFTRNTIIGVNRTMDKKQRHGVIWVNEPNDVVASYPFWVDRPEALVKPNFFTIHSLFEQITKMSYDVTHLEIVHGGKVRVYKYGQKRPIHVKPQ